MLLWAVLLLAQNPGIHKKKASPKSTPKKSASNKKSVAKKSPTRAAAPYWQTSQRTPTPDRYREIQQALAGKGYLQTDAPSGVWDNNSVEALKRFQQDQSLLATGKIDSLSLIALGLGPRRDPQPPPPPQP